MPGSLNSHLISGIPQWDAFNASLESVKETIVPTTYPKILETELVDGRLYGCNKNLIVLFGEVAKPSFDHGRFYIGSIIPSLRSSEREALFGIGGRVVAQSLRDILHSRHGTIPWLIYLANSLDGAVIWPDIGFGAVVFISNADAGLRPHDIHRSMTTAQKHSIRFRIVNEF